MCYLIYKLVNNFLFTVLFKRAAGCVFILRFAPRVVGVSFDFVLDHHTTHLGDRLFYSPLIYRLNECSLETSCNDHIMKDIFYEMYAINPFKPSACDIRIVPKPSLLSLLIRGNLFKFPVVVIDFTDTNNNSIITAELIKSFNSFFKLNLNTDIPLPVKCNEQISVNITLPAKPRYLFSNYVNSGFFRLHFLDKSRLIIKCRELKNMGYDIIHIGSTDDLFRDKKTYDFVTYDLRGKLSLKEVIALVRDQDSCGYIGYDNFIMHLSNYYSKISYVLFRGRVTPSQRHHHINKVNNCLSFDSSKIYYL